MALCGLSFDFLLTDLLISGQCSIRKMFKSIFGMTMSVLSDINGGQREYVKRYRFLVFSLSRSVNNLLLINY